MDPRDLKSLVLGNLRRMKARVVMTAMGVVIGTAAVVVLVSLGAGLERQTRESLMSGSGLTELQIIAPVNYVANSGMPGGRAARRESERSSTRSSTMACWPRSARCRAWSGPS
jgi:hypothetical protein